MPWPVGARELFARPVAPGRFQGLSRLTAPMHGPWFWVALWAATVDPASARWWGFATTLPGDTLGGVSKVRPARFVLGQELGYVDQ